MAYRSPIQRALKHANGNQSELARRIGCTQQLISLWLADERKISAEHAVALERETGIPRKQFRPDIFGEAK